ncbi:hypothetical protein BC832DRAFT_174804 [Gaertneriomyces semiglobifer]|nr:hypothetical protein BC832DRAFT_174804 [Gaertneriomyces semiglobifer]
MTTPRKRSNRSPTSLNPMRTMSSSSPSPIDTTMDARDAREFSKEPSASPDQASKQSRTTRTIQTTATSRKTSGLTRRKACEPCRLRKRKCDGERPICAACRVFGSGDGQCSYYIDELRKNHSQRSATPSTPSADYAPTTPNHVGEEPPLKRRAISRPQSALPTPSGGSSGAWSGQAPFAVREIANWGTLALNPEEMPSPSRNCLPVLPDRMPPHEIAKSQQERSDFRVRGLDISMRLIDVFFRYPGSQPPLNFLHRESFLTAVRYQEPFLLLTMQCLACKYVEENRRNGKGHEAGDEYYNMSRAMLPEVFEAPSLSSVQGLLILATCC